MTRFADQLFDDLMREHGDSLALVQCPSVERLSVERLSVERPSVERPSVQGRRSVRRPVWAAGLAAGVVGAGTAGVMVLGGTPAYAVTPNGDGTVKIAINRPSGIAEANAALAAKGLSILVVPVRSGCPDLGSLAVSAPATTGRKITANSRTSPDGHGSITVDVKGVPADQTMLVGVESANGRTTMAMAAISGAAPDCVSLPAAPPKGGGGSAPGGGKLNSVQGGQNDGPSTNRAG